jgi:hypothetical protein
MESQRSILMPTKTVWVPDEGDYVLYTRNRMWLVWNRSFEVPEGLVFKVEEVGSDWHNPDMQVTLLCGDTTYAVEIDDIAPYEGMLGDTLYHATIDIMQELEEKLVQDEKKIAEEKERSELYRLLSKYGLPDGYK